VLPCAWHCRDPGLRLSKTCIVRPAQHKSHKVNSHMPCRAPAILRQCRVLRESPRGSRKYPNSYSHSLTDSYASDNNLRGTPCGSRKKPKAGRSPTFRLWKADANLQCHTTPRPRCAMALISHFKNGTGVARAQHGMCESTTAALSKSNGNDTIYVNP
jgi:hypothetical protein